MLLRSVAIINSSGFEVKSQRVIRPIRKGYYVVQPESVGGDAPKDFIRVYTYGECRKSSPSKWPAYISKVGHKWYPNESITEHLLTRLGQELGLNIPESELRFVDNQIRFHSRYFLGKDENLTHGAQIFAAYLEDDEFVEEVEAKGMAREFFTFEFVVEAVKSTFPADHISIVSDFVRLLAFDAIVGNNDRHYFNWGVVVHALDRSRPTFSPVYDTARALFWNSPDSKVEEILADKFRLDAFLGKYIRQSKPKTGCKGVSAPNHFELMTHIMRNHQEYGSVLRDLLATDLLESLDLLWKTEFEHLMSSSRKQLIRECLARRLFEYRKAIETSR
ncbi:MAG: HipA domain-containing protein [Rhodothermia bacterium]